MVGPAVFAETGDNEDVGPCGSLIGFVLGVATEYNVGLDVSDDGTTDTGLSEGPDVCDEGVRVSLEGSMVGVVPPSFAGSTFGGRLVGPEGVVGPLLVVGG